MLVQNFQSYMSTWYANYLKLIHNDTFIRHKSVFGWNCMSLEKLLLQYSLFWCFGWSLTILRIILSNNTLSHAGIDFKHSTCVPSTVSA